MPVTPAYRAQVADLLDFTPQLKTRLMFGGAGVWSGELMFALIIDDELYFKTDTETRPLFEAEGCGPWLYLRGGEARDMGYSRAPDMIWDDPDEARRWADLALGAARRRHKPKSPKR